MPKGFLSWLLAPLLASMVILAGPGVWVYDRHFSGWEHIVKFGPFKVFTFRLNPGPGWTLTHLKPVMQAAKIIRIQTVIREKAEVTENNAQAKIKIVYRDIIKEVPAYVTSTTDRTFPLSVGFVRVLDAGAAGVSPTTIPTEKPDDTASSVAPRIVAENTVDDFGICRANTERLTALQSFISDEIKAAGQ